MPQEFLNHEFESGLRLVGEPMPGVSSAAYSLLIPAGAAYDPEGQFGASGVLTELSTRGAGELSNRELSIAYDGLGISRSQSSGVEVVGYSGAMLAENLAEALRLLGNVVLRPRLEAAELEPVRSLALQEIRSLEDEPASKVMVELGKRFYPEPFGRSQLGERADIESLKLEQVQAQARVRFVPGRMVLAVAGKFDWTEVIQTVGESFEAAATGSLPSLLEKPKLSEESRDVHIEKDTAQVQIAMAHPSVSYSHPDYYTARVAVGVLSGGMAGRLFVEVREKRGLVYRVSASHSGQEGRAAIFASAGTTVENAKECVEVMQAQLRSLEDGASDEELKRAKADLKSRIVMQGEISSARAGAITSDIWNLGRPRTLQEVGDAIESVTSADISNYAKKYPFEGVCMVTLGSKWK